MDEILSVMDEILLVMDEILSVLEEILSVMEEILLVMGEILSVMEEKKLTLSGAGLIRIERKHPGNFLTAKSTIYRHLIAA